MCWTQSENFRSYTELWRTSMVVNICEKNIAIENFCCEKIKEWFNLNILWFSTIRIKRRSIWRDFFLVDICATFQASSVNCGREFGQMNLIISKSRKRLEGQLKNLMRIKYYISLGCSIDPHGVHKYWASKK